MRTSPPMSVIWMLYCWFSQDTTPLLLPLILPQSSPICFHLPHSTTPLPYTQLSQKWSLRQGRGTEVKRSDTGKGGQPTESTYGISYHCGQLKLNPVGKLWEIVSNTCLNIIPLEGEGSWGTYTPIPVIHWKGCSWGSLFLPAVHMGRSEVTFQKKSSGSEMQILQLEACWSTRK